MTDQARRLLECELKALSFSGPASVAIRALLAENAAQAKQLAAAKAENERLKVENAKWPSQWIREIDKAVAAERAAQDGAALAALRKEQDAFNAEVRELQDINARLLRERDAAVRAAELGEQRDAAVLQQIVSERDAAVQAKGLEIKAAHDERAEADAAVRLDALGSAEVAVTAMSKVLIDKNIWDVTAAKTKTLAKIKAALATNCGAALLEERDRYKAVTSGLLAFIVPCKSQNPEWLELEECPAGHDLECGRCLAVRQARAALAQQPDQRPTKE